MTVRACLPSQKCKALLCDEKSRQRSRYCRRHASCETNEMFGDALRPQIEAIGAKRVPSALDEKEQGWRYELPTLAGKLTMTFYVDSYTLFTRFEDVERGNKLVGGNGHLHDAVNPCSGKWNHHITDGYPVEDAVTYVMNQLRRVLP